ncbi:glycosyltransferase [Bradyrhizobium sp. DN5]|uniref:glycosyltransferase n=1 Tax=Bradyrhizobium sp. DN5 TaxID=3056950 RepID=UPI003526830B
MGKKVYFLGDSKFDDYPRWVGREWLKSLFLLPYVGALTASWRSQQYLEFLGWKKRPIELGYDTISVDRIRMLAGSAPAPGGCPHSERHFTVVARHVPKKNIALALQAFADFTRENPRETPRRLVLCGSGPLEEQLKECARRLSVEHLVDFRGFVQTDQVCQALSNTLCLILPSIEEQFGQVVPEALAMGVPVALSTNCGARDELVRSGVNGFVFEPDNVTGLRNFLCLISRDENFWSILAKNAHLFVSLGDVERFANSVERLTSKVKVD